MKVGVLFAIWLATIVVGLYPLLCYESKPAEQCAPATKWPSPSLLHSAGRSTLVMFVHPKCPCSRASLKQLEKLHAGSVARLDCIVLIAQPKGMDSRWTRSDLWEQASAIPGVRVAVDTDEKEAECFGAQTSGEVFVYDGDSNLSFHGGLTIARGHEGDSPGFQAVKRIINHRSENESACSATFGCSLFNHKGLN